MCLTSSSKDIAMCPAVIADIIADVFISADMYGVCLPASLILMEQLQKLKLNPVLNCGQMKYEANEPEMDNVPVHFWVSVGEEIIDPTLKISRGLGMDFSKLKYHPGEEVVDDEESLELKQLYDYLKNTDNMIEEYFKGAPEKLNTIRNVIDYKIEHFND